MIWIIECIYYDASNCIRGRTTVVYKLSRLKTIKAQDLSREMQELAESEQLRRTPRETVSA